MFLFSVSEMKAIDQMAIDKYGISSSELMENAAHAVCRLILSKFDKNTTIGIVCGKGNNGGDGLALARLLSEKHNFAHVSIFLIFHPGEFSKETSFQWHKINPRYVKIFGAKDLDKLKDSEVIIDALLGIGLKNDVEEPLKSIVQKMNEAHKKIISIDVPSGLDADTAEPHGIAVHADMTITLGGVKTGLSLHAASSYVGELHVDSIGIPQALLRSNKKILKAENLRQFLTEKNIQTHKGREGHVFCIGGTREKEGAIEMTALGALRVGCGLSTIMSFAKLSHVPLPVMYEKLGFFWKRKLASVIPSLSSRALRKNPRKSSSGQAPALASPKHCEGGRDPIIALGPGLGTSKRAQKLTQFIIEKFEGHLVIDADGLNCLSDIPASPVIASLQSRCGNLPILTPHPGEFSRLTHYAVSEIQKHRAELALEYASRWGAILVLKGAGTVIASPHHPEAFINPTGNPGMASAGMGDVLTGIIAGFCARGLKPYEAAQLSVYVHGYAADLVKKETGNFGILATDVISNLSKALSSL